MMHSDGTVPAATYLQALQDGATPEQAYALAYPVMAGQAALFEIPAHSASVPAGARRQHLDDSPQAA